MSANQIARLFAAIPRYLRLDAFDTSTVEGQTAERYRRVALAAVASLGSRLSGVLLMVLTVYAAAPYLGATRFGVWATFASLAAMLSFLDLGVGNALVNRVSQAAASNNMPALRRVVAGGIGWLALIGALMAVSLAGISSHIPWGALLNLSDAATTDEARTAALAFSCLFGLQMLGSGALKVLVGQQRSHEANVISGFGTLLACATVTWAAYERAGVAHLLIAGFGVQAAAGLLALPLLWFRGLLKGEGLFDCMRSERAWLFRAGALFLFLQIGTMVGWGSDPLLLASFVGPAEVAKFFVAQRLFQFAAQPFAIINAPLWAAYADAQARADHLFLRRTLTRSLLLSGLGAALMAAVLCALAPLVIPYWTRGSIEVPVQLVIFLAVWTVFEACGTAFGTYLNGAGIVREQVVVVVIFCAVALPLKVFAATYAGAPGLVFAAIIAYGLTVVLPYATIFRHRVLAPLAQSTQ